MQLGFWLLASCATAKPVVEEARPQGPPPICAVASPDLCLQDGIDLWVGNGREIDRAAAQGKFELACTGGLPRGCTFLAIALKEGDALDRARAFDLFDQSCEKSEPMACAQLGTEYLVQAWLKSRQSGSPETASFIAANDRLRRACIAEEAPDALKVWGFSVRGYACGNLATSYENGFAVPQDYKTAMELNDASCGMGWTRSCAQLGYFWEQGLGVEKDLAKATAIYEQACADEDAMACHNLGMLLRETNGQRATEAFRIACDQNYPGSCEALKGEP